MSTEELSTEKLSKEQRILRLMRKTLGNVVKDVTPIGGRTNPLSESTIQDIKDCFSLISLREKELAEALNFDQSKPYYADGEVPNAKVISFIKPHKE
ncbi:MAG: segregation and condensation protein A [Gallionella sp.]